MFYYFKFVYIVNILKLKLKIICSFDSIGRCWRSVRNIITENPYIYILVTDLQSEKYFAFEHQYCSK